LVGKKQKYKKKRCPLCLALIVDKPEHWEFHNDWHVSMGQLQRIEHLLTLRSGKVISVVTYKRTGW
jgi:hypothetical protein